VISLNLKRRHLTQSQRAIVAAKALPLIQAEAKKRQAEAGIRTQALKKGDKEALCKNAESCRDTIYSNEVTAKQFSVSTRYVTDAKEIIQADPALAAEVETGKKTMQSG
jgi:hypothetical protein